jgi:hypothetical protein
MPVISPRGGEEDLIAREADNLCHQGFTITFYQAELPPSLPAGQEQL